MKKPLSLSRRAVAWLCLLMLLLGILLTLLPQARLFPAARLLRAALPPPEPLEPESVT